MGSAAAWLGMLGAVAVAWLGVSARAVAASPRRRGDFREAISRLESLPCSVVVPAVAGRFREAIAAVDRESAAGDVVVCLARGVHYVAEPVVVESRGGARGWLAVRGEAGHTVSSRGSAREQRDILAGGTSLGRTRFSRGTGRDHSNGRGASIHNTHTHTHTALNTPPPLPGGRRGAGPTAVSRHYRTTVRRAVGKTSNSKW